MDQPERVGPARVADLSGQIALVVGASGAIGTEIARRFAEAGASIALHYRRQERAASELGASLAADGTPCAIIGSELADEADAMTLVNRTAAQLGGVDILVNAAGEYPVAELARVPLADWGRTHQVNIMPAVACTKAVSTQMQARGGGSIINIASIAALVPAPHQSHYSSAKAALVMFTRSMAQELAPYRIRVNSVSPGLIARPGLERDWPSGVARWMARVPLGRLGTPTDVAAACLFLASPASGWVTGHNLVVDGGMSAAPMY